MKKEIKKEIISDLLVIVSAIIILFIITKFLCTFIQVKGSSMVDTLYENDRGMSFYYDLDNIQRFDIIVVDNGNNKNLIKRVIGLPKEEIEYRNNKLYVNGSFVEEEFLSDDITTDDFKVKLEDDEYFCLGDNRIVSNDSRTYGPFNKKDIKTTHFFRIYPFDRIGFIK